jgi:hypothetical protein
MSDDRYLLEQIVSQEHHKNAPKLKKDEYFEVFSAEQILKMGGGWPRPRRGGFPESVH